jgi:tetratricopeptide (TPR) repeat protein
MRSQMLLLVLLCASSCAFGSDSKLRSCRLHVIMSNGTELPAHLKLQIFANGKRVSEIEVPYSGEIALSPLLPGTYRMQTGGAGANFLTSGPLQVPAIGDCEAGINIIGRAGGENRLTEDDVDIEDLRLSNKAREKFERAFADVQHGDLNKAADGFLEVTKMAPRLSRTYNILGVIKDQQGDRVAARGFFNKALELNPRSKAAQMNLIKLCMSEKQYETALAMLDRYRLGTRDDADLHAIAANADLKLERYDAAIREAHAAHALSHVNWESVHVVAATAYEALHLPEKAAEELQTYMQETSNPAFRKMAGEKIRELESVAQQSSAAAPINSFVQR